MNRMERKLKGKRRRRKVFFSLFLIVLLFSMALIATNNTMVQATGLSPDKNLISVQGVQAYVAGKAGHVVGYIVEQVNSIDMSAIKQKAEQLLKQVLDFLGSLKMGLNSL